MSRELPDFDVEIVTSISVKVEVPGVHAWPEAPASVAFLRSPHRHLFRFLVEREVTLTPDQSEVFAFRQAVMMFLNRAFARDRAGNFDFGTHSIAVLARMVLDAVPHVDWCAVSEDDEFTATVERIYVSTEEPTIHELDDDHDEEGEEWKRE